ncbi:hypothetical protein IJF91_00165 [Candidatus Saccharibacteria bacterium]|nr:hypothetical protein [Candidatus Saccharibacteria bacterium]
MKIAKKHSRFTSHIMIALIFITVLTVIIAIFVQNLQDKNFFVNQKFESLSKSYYEEVLYPEFIEEHKNESLESAFEKYKNNGFTVRLRQILNYEFLNKNNDYRSVFEGNNFSCDTNSSTAKFVPRSPFGKTDYDAEFNLICTND